MCTRKRIIESTPTTILQERTEYQFLLNSFVFSFVGLKCSFDFWLRKEYYSCIVAEITVKHAGQSGMRLCGEQGNPKSRLNGLDTT